MALPEALHEALEAELGDSITSHVTVGGGCMANAGRIETETRSYFLKWSRNEVAETFPAEVAGLEALAAANSPLHIPAVVACGSVTDAVPGFLVLEWINSGRQGLTFWTTFGEGLAAMHTHAADRYGFEHDNFIGRLPQENEWATSWPRFFRSQRLAPQVRRARDQGRWRDGWDAPLKTLYRRLPDLLPSQPSPSVLHGDLWSGNFMVTALGMAALIDPAVYFGHREADLAMTELFGGFDEDFYASYRAAAPLEPGYAQRREVYNLYHLINHLNHFGGRYAGSVDAVLNTFR